MKNDGTRVRHIAAPLRGSTRVVPDNPLRSALLRELSSAYAAYWAALARVDEVLAQLQQAQQDTAEDQRAETRARLEQHRRRRTGRVA